MTRIPFARPDLPPTDQVLVDVATILKSGRVGNYGPWVKALESKANEWVLGTATRGVVRATASGDAALRIAFRYFGETRRQAYIPNWTFQSTVNAALDANLIVHLIPTDPETLCADLSRLPPEIEGLVNILCVTHTFGCTAATEAARAWREDSVTRRVIFDAAHAFRPGLPWIGDASAFSLSGTKVVTCGEGGLLAVAKDDEALDRLGNYGFWGTNYDVEYPQGINAKMAEIPAAIAVRSMAQLEAMTQRRAAMSCAYIDVLARCGQNWQDITGGDVRKDFCAIFNTLLTRKVVEHHFADADIETRRYFRPISMQRGYAASMVRTMDPAVAAQERALWERTLCLPFGSAFTDEETERVCDVLKRALA